MPKFFPGTYCTVHSYDRDSFGAREGLLFALQMAPRGRLLSFFIASGSELEWKAYRNTTQRDQEVSRS